MAQLPRGIAPDLLLSQIKSTMPYVFEAEGATLALSYPPARIAREINPSGPLSHFEYFRLCLSAHYLTVATPVPTDVDNQIRQKLWPAHLPLEIALEMGRLVSESHNWNFRLVTRRFATGAKGTSWETQCLSGHLGEWFTVAAGAYCALLRYVDPKAKELRAEILEQVSSEVTRHSEVFGSLWRAGDGLGALKAAAAIAHNFGDLDRVMDQWELAVNDPLRLSFYQLGVKPFGVDGKLRYLGRLWVAGELYKAPIPGGGGSSMALENHRHFALRKPKSLRISPELMITTGPFLEDWGRNVGQRVGVSTLPEVVEALVTGWRRLPKTVGYGRALRGILEGHPSFLETATLSKAEKAIVEESTDRFERKWAEGALGLMEDIPSRA